MILTDDLAACLRLTLMFLQLQRSCNSNDPFAPVPASNFGGFDEFKLPPPPAAAAAKVATASVAVEGLRLFRRG